MKKKHEEYEDKIIDIDELIGTDIKINPDYYIHNAIIKAQQALVNPDVKIGFMQFRILVENIEILSKAAKMIPNDYDEQIEKYKKTDDYTTVKENIREVKLANKKMEILLTQVFGSKSSTSPLKA